MELSTISNFMVAMNLFVYDEDIKGQCDKPFFAKTLKFVNRLGNEAQLVKTIPRGSLEGHNWPDHIKDLIQI